MSKITATLNAYINPEYPWMQDDYLNAMKDGDHARAINAVSLTTSKRKDCVFMGKATITLETVDGDSIKTGMVSALKEQRAEVMAVAQAKATEIDTKIQNLLAIEFTPS